MNKKGKRIKKINEKLTEKVMELVYNNTNEFIEELWHLITLAENNATTIEHLECYEFYTQKKDISEYYEKIIEEGNKEFNEKFLEFIKKYNK